MLAKARLDSAMRTGFYALGLAIDFVMASARGYDPFNILDEISALEGGQRSTTKPAKLFKRRLLCGYWHKHHTQAGQMPHNMLNEMMHDKTVERVLVQYMGQALTPEIINRLCHTLLIDNYFRRLNQGRLTGEWIIFSKKGGANYYVTLASHGEGGPIIAKRVHDYEDLDQRMGWRSAR